MSKPEDIPQDVWDIAKWAWVAGASSANVTNTGHETVARAIMAERERCAKTVMASAIPMNMRRHIAIAIRKGTS